MNEFRLKRIKFGDTFTIGQLYLNDAFLCYTLEDTVREVIGEPVSSWKQYGVTAIPTGTYKVILSLSNRFKKILPEVLNVEGYTGVRIHAGNKPEDTEGCILVGESWDGNTGFIGNSKIALNNVMPLFDKSGNNTLIIE